MNKNQDVKVGDIWVYGDIYYYIITRAESAFVDLYEIETSSTCEGYDIGHFNNKFVDTDKYMWELISRLKRSK